MIAGGGIGGLFTALTLRNEGYEVSVYEKTTEYRSFGGPIQIASNGLEAVRRIDKGVYDRILEEATCLGDRVNGLKDGVSNEWFATFDLATPAAARGQKPSVVIDRPVLQQILLDQVGDCLTMGQEVVGCERRSESGAVAGVLADGTTQEADLLVGSDGLRSKIRDVVSPDVGEPAWSGYTCFAAIAYTVPSDIKEVGYKVFLGRRKYFVSVDVGGGRLQWYAFLNIPPGALPEECKRGEPALSFLRDEFEGWSPEVFELLDNTPFEEIEQRDLYDRPPQVTWSSGRVCLLGDAAHPMMPNLGQGGCMAIEDAFVLGRELRGVGHDRAQVPLALKRYNQNRVVRAAAVQGMSRVSSAFLFQYNHPVELEQLWPPKLKNASPKSIITRMGQGFMQHAAFPLQFEFLFDFPGPLGEEELRGPDGANALERLLMTAEMGAVRMFDSSRREKPRPS
jgi:zeaxanthin epoxidase